MPPTTLRASYTISAPLLQRFNAVVPHGERSRVMEELMKQALVKREAELENIAAAFMTDPAFAECRDDENAGMSPLAMAWIASDPLISWTTSAARFTGSTSNQPWAMNNKVQPAPA